MSGFLHIAGFGEWAAIVQGKAVVLRKLIVVLTLCGQCFTAESQIYFDNLYGNDSTGGGIGIGGTVQLGSDYYSWSNFFLPPRLCHYSFIVDADGNLITDFGLGTADTVSEQSGNVIVKNDTILVGMAFQQVLAEAIPGDAVLSCHSSQGFLYWKRVIGQPDRLDIPQRIGLTDDGGFILVGQTTIGNGNGQSWLVKTDSVGNVEWEQNYGGSLYENGADVAQTPDGGYLLLGWTRSFGAGQRDFYLLKTDSTGNEQWHETYGGAGEDVGSSILRLTNGNYLLTGGGTNAAVTTAKGFLYEVTPGGQQVWHQEYASGPSEGDHLFMSVQLADGSIVSCGLADNNGTGGNAGWLVKTDANGDLLWQREYDKNQYTDLFYSLLATDDGGFLLSGQAIDEVTLDQDAWLLKVDSVGCTFPNCITGIDEAGSKEILVDVWPNPATDVLNIEKLDPSTSLRVTAYDLSGREILRFTQNTRRSTIDVSNWPNGVYLVTGVDKEGRVFSVKVVKE